MNAIQIEDQLKELEKRIGKLESSHRSSTEELDKRVAALEGQRVFGEERLYVEDVIRELGIKRSTLYRMCQLGKIPCHRPSDGRLTFFASELKEWIHQNNYHPRAKEEAIRKAKEWKNRKSSNPYYHKK